jgi:hypothetical protein
MLWCSAGKVTFCTGALRTPEALKAAFWAADVRAKAKTSGGAMSIVMVATDFSIDDATWRSNPGINAFPNSLPIIVFGFISFACESEWKYGVTAAWSSELLADDDVVMICGSLSFPSSVPFLFQSYVRVNSLSFENNEILSLQYAG